MPPDQIIRWSSDLNRLRPDVGKDQLMFLFDLFKIGELTWDRNKGIQNIFEGLRETEFVEGVWRKVKHWPG